MCLISYFPPGVWADERALLRGAEVNDEGFGYAISDGGMLITWKDACGPLQAVARFLAARDAHPDSHAVFHSRLSTGSAVSAANCHPVEVDGDPLTVVFHNGSLPYEPAWLELTGDSDTRVFAEESFPAIFSDLDDEATFGMLEAWATPANKLVIMTANPRYSKPCYVVNRDQFIADEHGALHSNADFRGFKDGWDQETDSNGDLWRWNVPGRTRLRNETRRRAKVAAAGERKS